MIVLKKKRSKNFAERLKALMPKKRRPKKLVEGYRARYARNRAAFFRERKRLRERKKGLIFITLLYLYYDQNVITFFFTFSTMVMLKFFKLENLLLFFFMLKKNSRFMFLFNFLRYFDKFFIVFFNFYVLFKKLVGFVDSIKFGIKDFPFCFSFFLPNFRFFILLEVFLKNFNMNWFNYDFFYYNEYNLAIYNYVISYDKFLMRLDTGSFLLLFKESEAVRMAKYNEYLFNNRLFWEHVNFRFLFLQRYTDILEDLYVTQVCSFKFAIKDFKFLLFQPRYIVKDRSVIFRKVLINCYNSNNNFILKFMSNIKNLKYLNKIMLFILDGYLQMYTFVDIYFAFMSRLKLVTHFFWRFFHFTDMTRKVYSFQADALYLFFFIKLKIDLKLSYFAFNGWGFENYYLYNDLILNFKKSLRSSTFFFELLELVFCDFNSYLIISTVDNVEINQSFFFSMYRHFDIYINTLIFNFFNVDVLDYLKWFFGFEYFYWRILNVDFSYKFGLSHYWRSPDYDFLFYTRYISSYFVFQKCLGKIDTRSILSFFYLFSLYSDIILKSIISSFDINLLFYFMFNKFYFYDDKGFQYIVLLNSDLKFVSKFFKENFYDFWECFRAEKVQEVVEKKEKKERKKKKKV